MASSAPQIATEAHAAETTEAQGSLNLEEQELAVVGAPSILLPIEPRLIVLVAGPQ